MEYHSFKSENYPGRFIRHQDFAGKVTEVTDDLGKADATFNLERLTHNQVRFRSVNLQGHVLRHRNFEIWLDQFNPPIIPPGGSWSPKDQQTSKDSTFVLVPGLAGSGVSFQSTNFPDRFIRHRNFRLYVEPAADDLSRHDATFQIVDPFVKEGPGPVIH